MKIFEEFFKYCILQGKSHLKEKAKQATKTAKPNLFPASDFDKRFYGAQ